MGESLKTVLHISLIIHLREKKELVTMLDKETKMMTQMNPKNSTSTTILMKREALL